MRCSLNIFVGSAGGVKDHALQMMNLYLECGIVKTCMLVCLSVQCLVQSTPDNSNLPGKSKKGSSSRQFEENCRDQGEKKKKKKQFLQHSEHFNHINFNRRNVK